MNKKQDFILTPRTIYNFKPQEKIVYDSIIIGAGIAGFSAAMYGARLGLKVLVIGKMSGGKITLTESIENYPGFVSINGLKLAELVENHARDYDIDILTDIVEKISRKNNLYVVSTAKKRFIGKTVIIATGTVEKKLNVPGEKEFTGNGVSYCAICDATTTKNKIVAVVGGGDGAVKEANLLAKYAKKVWIINNEPKIHGEKYNLNSVAANVKKKKIEVINSANIISIDGKSRVEGVTFNKGNKKRKIMAEWVFIYIGQTPRVIGKELGIKTNKKGEIIIDIKCETNIKGIYAAGDVTSTSWKQAIIAAAQGVTAAFSAYNYLTKINKG